jgi:hypothetical protein
MEKRLNTNVEVYGILDGSLLKGIVEVKGNLEIEVVGGKFMEKGASYQTLSDFKRALYQKAEENYPGTIVESIL